MAGCRARRFRLRRSSQKLYDQYWKGFDDEKSYWPKEVRQGRLKRARLDLFLNHYLTMMKGDEVIISQMFLDYKELVSSRNGTRAQEHLQDFDSYAGVYESFERFADDSREGVFCHRLDEMDTTTVFPLLPQVFKKHPSDDIDFSESRAAHNRWRSVTMNDLTTREPANDPQDLERLLVARENAGDVTGMTALFEPDAVVDIGGGTFLRGKETIHEFFTKLQVTGFGPEKRKFEFGEQRPALILR